MTSIRKSKIAIVGPEDIVLDCLELANSFPFLDLIPRPYENEGELKTIIKSLENRVDAILFGGQVPYNRVKEMVESKKIESIFLPFNGTGLFKALYKLGQRDLTRVSIDTMNKKPIEETFLEIELSEYPKYILEFDSSENLDEVTNYHKNLFMTGKIDVAMTSVGYCYRELEKLGIPVYRIKPLKSVIRETLEKIELICENNWNKENLLSVGIVSVDNYNKWISKKSISEMQELELLLEQSVFNFVKSINGHHIRLYPGEFLFFSTRGFIEDATDLYEQAPSLYNDPLLLTKELTLSMGISFARSTNVAAEYARMALKRAQEMGGDKCLIINERHELLGPLGRGEFLRDSIRNTDERLQELSAKVGVSLLTLQKIYKASQQLDGEFTANDIASLIGITLKSTQRILRILEMSKLVHIIGKESNQGRGKPRRVYKMNELVI